MYYRGHLRRGLHIIDFPYFPIIYTRDVEIATLSRSYIDTRVDEASIKFCVCVCIMIVKSRAAELKAFSL